MTAVPIAVLIGAVMILKGSCLAVWMTVSTVSQVHTEEPFRDQVKVS